MSRTSIAILAVGLAAVTAAPAASAGDPPAATADAEAAGLRVTSSVAVTQRLADMRGAWSHTDLECDQFRRLRVAVVIRYAGPNDIARRIVRSRSRVVRNCVAPPRFGIRILAADTVPRPEGNHPHLALACPDGRWRPGSYTFTVRTTHKAALLSAIVSVAWRNTRRC